VAWVSVEPVSAESARVSDSASGSALVESAWVSESVPAPASVPAPESALAVLVWEPGLAAWAREPTAA
jgi:hypothetical protein